MKDFCLCHIVKPLLSKILGDQTKASFEKRLSLVSSLTVSLVAFLGTFINFALGLWSEGAASLMLAVGASALFIYVRRGNFNPGVIYGIAFITFVYYNLAWLFGSGSEGPTLFTFISTFLFFTLVWEEKKLPWLVGIGFANLALFYFIETRHPGLLTRYDSVEQRILDQYTTAALVLGIVFVLTIYFRQNYTTQYEKAKHSDELKTAFLANLSHEIRTPLNALIGFSSILAEEDLPREEIKMINKILDLNAKQFLYLIEDTIDLSKIETGQIQITSREFNVNRMFEQFKANMEDGILEEQRQRLIFNFDVKAADGLVFADEKRIVQIMRILISNAVSYSDEGEICVGVSDTGIGWEFFVKDQGRGILPEKIDTIFDLFVKIKSSDTQHERGIGMGLYLARQLVELMGGMIWVHSVYGQGSEFRFSIPKQSSQGCEIR